MGIISCRSCLRPILEYDEEEISRLAGYEPIRASQWRCIVPNHPGIRDGEEMSCPYCRHNYMSSIQIAWRCAVDNKKGMVLVGDWDR